MAGRGSEADPVVTRDQAAAAQVQNGAQSAGGLAANTNVADTGALPAGDYMVEFTAAILGVAAAGKGLVVEHRNAANGANITILGGLGAGGGPLERRICKVPIALNERIRIRTDAVPLAASEIAVAAIRVYRLP